MLLELYKKATRDYELVHVIPSQQKITAYGVAKIPVVRKVFLRVWRGDFKCRLDCKIVHRCNIRPLLGRRFCVGVKIVAYLDNELNKPSTGTSEVYALSSGNNPLTQEQRIQKYSNVLSEGVGRLES